MCTCAGAVCMHGVYMLSACMHVLCVHVSERTCMYVCLHAHTSIFPPHQFTFLAACSACSWYLDFLPGKVRISSSSPSSSSCVVLHCSACQQFTQPLPHSTVVYTGYSLSHTSQHSTVVSPHRIRPLPQQSTQATAFPTHRSIPLWLVHTGYSLYHTAQYSTEASPHTLQHTGPPATAFTTFHCG